MPWFKGPEGVPTHWIGPLPQGLEEIPAPVTGEYEAKAAAARRQAAAAAAADLAAAAAAPVPKEPDYELRAHIVGDSGPEIIVPARRPRKKAGA